MKILGKGRICMKRMIPVLGALLLLTACTPAESVLPAATPAPEPTAVPSPLPAASPTPSPTAVPVEEASLPETTLEEWTSVMPEQRPGYTVTEQGPLELLDYVAWPDQPVELQIDSWKGTLEEAAEAFGVPLETLQEMNPDPETSNHTSDGSTIYYNLKLQENYQVPRPDIKQVTISTPWVPAGGSRRQAMRCRRRSVTRRQPAWHPPTISSITTTACRAASGRRTMTRKPAGTLPKRAACIPPTAILTRYLEAVYSPAVCEGILGGPVAEENPDDWHPYYQGENDEIVFQGGDRGSNIRHCGTSFTEPELQPDGSIQFWQLSLTVESDDFVGWGEGITYTRPIRPVPPSCGWNPPKPAGGWRRWNCPTDGIYGFEREQTV